MKRVYNRNYEVVAAWAEQVTSEGRTKHLFFDGPTIYSYGYHFPMATFHKGFVMVTNRRWGPATSAHQGLVWAALRYCCSPYKVLEVYDPRCEEHTVNLQHLTTRIRAFALKVLGARRYTLSYMQTLEDARRMLRDYCGLFQLRQPDDPTKDLSDRLIVKVITTQLRSA